VIPFVILALPRSRTYWLSRLLTYRGYQCAHEQARYLRGIDDVRSWLSQDYVGSCETAAARWWRLIKMYRPETRIVVVRRPVVEVVDSLMRVPGVNFDCARLTALIARQDRALDQVAKHALAVEYADLAREDICREVFEHCLPYDFDRDWWFALDQQNLQCDLPAMMRYFQAHAPQLFRLTTAATRALRSNRPRETLLPDIDVVFREESWDNFFRDGAALFAEHSVAVGDPSNEWQAKNIPLMRALCDAGAASAVTARVNGRMMGYLLTFYGPSLENAKRLVGTQTIFFASKDAHGMNLGMRLQRASIEAAKRRGAGEILMRAGVRGSGPKMGALYRRLGAEDAGHLYRLSLEAG